MELAEIWKKVANKFVKCRMSDLRKGDIFIYGDKKIKMIAASDPFFNEEGIYSIHARE